MAGKLLLAFCGTLFLMGMALAGDPEQQDMSTLHKDRRLAVVNELIKAQEQIAKALWKMYRATAPPGEHGGPEEVDCSDESKESAEEDAHMEMKQKKIKETRVKLHSHVHNVAQNFLSMSNAIDCIEKKVHKEIKDKKSVVNYSLFYNKRGSSEEHSGEHSKEHGNKHPPSMFHYRASRQLQDVAEPVANVEEQKEPEEVVKTVDGEEVVQTLPE